MPLAQIIINGHFMAGIEQFFRANRSDVSRSAGDKDVHAGATYWPLHSVSMGKRPQKKGPIRVRIDDAPPAPLPVQMCTGMEAPVLLIRAFVKLSFVSLTGS